MSRTLQGTWTLILPLCWEWSGKPPRAHPILLPFPGSFQNSKDTGGRGGVKEKEQCLRISWTRGFSLLLTLDINVILPVSPEPNPAAAAISHNTVLPSLWCKCRLNLIKILIVLAQSNPNRTKPIGWDSWKWRNVNQWTVAIYRGLWWQEKGERFQIQKEEV